jgi:hypothetical protein
MNVRDIKMDVRQLDWVYVTRDKNQWRASVSMVWTFGFHEV